MFLFLFTFT